MGKLLLGLIFSAAVLLTFTLEGSAQTRINFAKGRTSATVTGTLPRSGKRTYVLGAKHGQYLSGNVSSRNGCVKFTEGSTSMGFTTDTGDNRVTITNSCGGSTTFTLTVSINYGSD